MEDAQAERAGREPRGGEGSELVRGHEHQQARAAQRVDSSIQTLRMTLISRTGAERVRELEMRVRKDGEVIKSYARFSKPSDVAGTQLVIVDHPDRPDDQLLYLPALNRVNRIAGKSRSGSFMGSDFAFEDFELSGSEGGTQALSAETSDAWILDVQPSESASYSRMLVTVHKGDKLPRRVEYFDKKGQALKVLEVVEVSTDGGFPFPVKTIMRNLQKGTETRLDVLSHELDVGEDRIPDETFTSAYMEQQR